MKIKLKIDFLNKEPVEGNPQTNKTQVDKSKTINYKPRCST